MSILRWTRDGVLTFAASPFETLDQLVLSPPLREKLQGIIETYLGGEQEYHRLGLPWREGLFFFGPSGAGKSAAARAVAIALGWKQFCISSHQILDSHLLERALSEAVEASHRVIVLEDIDQMVRTMDPNVFFSLLDSAMSRGDATFWIACTKHPEETPKTQLLRPGRFDEAIRFDAPPKILRGQILKRILSPYLEAETAEAVFEEFLEETQNLTFSHFEELRALTARAHLQGRDAEIQWLVRSYLQDQVIAGDRWGGVSDATQEVQDRVKAMDPRVLVAALDMSDVFRRLIEKVLGDAAEQAKTNADSESRS